MVLLDSIFGRGDFLPHGYCFTWTPALLWSMVGADGVIAAAYFSIPVAILSFVRQRRDGRFNGVAILFSAFIFSCAVTHMMDIWTIWQPDYRLQALTKAITAGISIVTAAVLWPLIPKALRVPSVERLQATIALLEAEVARRREAERQVVDIEQSLAVSLASIGAGFIATDRVGKVSRMNEVAEGLLGWTQADAVGCTLWQVFDREGRPAEEDPDLNDVDAAIAGGATVDTLHHVVARSRDGTRREVEFQLAPTHGKDGAVLGLAMVFRDMTRLVRAEADSKRLAAIVESSNDAIIGKSLDGEILSWNPAAERLFGYSHSQAIGRNVRMLIPPEGLADEARIIADLHLGRPIAPFDAVRLARSGQRLDMSIMISPIRDGRGRLIGASKIARDASVQRLAEAAIVDACAKAQQASLAKSRFLANVSHEIRTPMNAVVGLTYLLGLSTLDAPQADMVGKLRVASKSLLRVIDDVLELSKIEAGELKLEHAPFVLRDVLSELTALTAPLASAKGIRFSIDTPADLPVAFEGDSGCIRQVLLNLVTNAVKFTHEGSVTLNVSRLASKDGPPPGADRAERLLFTVTDTGIGIAPADAAQIFAPFVQVDSSSSRRYGGTGLGLSIVERLVSSMGGSVGVESRPGIGSSFWFEVGLPVAVITPPAIDTATAPESRALQGMRILIADDSEINLEVASRILTNHGAQTTLVHDGLQAVDVLRQRPEHFDAVLMDIQMPVLDGREATRCIREELGLMQLPIIALSAGALIHEQEGARQAGMTAFVRKPFGVHDLVRTLLHHVPRSAAALPQATTRPKSLVHRAFDTPH